ncbi:MAG TPA: DUF1549 domain-containing protein, partial [Gemmataceae bacterium]|nr:DUF1549 domain-containing protein [Gemmataceae bacterium]
MLPSAKRGSTLKRVIVLVVCLPLLGGVLLAIQNSVQAKDDEKPTPPPAKSAPTQGSNKNWKEAANLIDELLQKNWADNKITPAPGCDDYEFIRRASLDIVGRIATPEEIDLFLKDTKEKRR